MLVVGANCDSDVELVVTEMDSNAGTSRYQLNCTPLNVLKCVGNLVDIKRTWSDDDEEPAKPTKKRKFRRIEPNESDSSQTTRESADSDADVLQLIKKRKTLAIASSDDSEDNLPLAAIKQKLMADRKKKQMKKLKRLKKMKTHRIVRASNDSDSSSEDLSDDNLPLAKQKRMAGSSSGAKEMESEDEDEEKEEPFVVPDSGSDDSQLSGNSRNASASSSSSDEDVDGALVIDEDDDDRPSWRRELNDTLHNCPMFNRTLISTAQTARKNKRDAEYQLQESLTVTKLKEIEKELKSRPKESEQAKQPRLVTMPLMSHQLNGLKFMLWRETCSNPGGIICNIADSTLISNF